MSLELCGECLFWPSLWLVALNSTRKQVWVVSETLCSLQWCVALSFQRGLYY